jgi:hypothetical protein
MSLEKNFITLAIAAILFFGVKEINDGYKWFFGSLLKNNIKMLQDKKVKRMNLNQKYESKLGFDYRFLKHIADNTPENAIILMPPDSIIFPKKGRIFFNKSMKSASIRNKSWASYFVYPRKLVYEKINENSKYVDKATHVAIVNHWGYHKLKNPPRQRQQFAVIPLK